MERWRPFLEGAEPWEFLQKVASGITGLDVEILPGTMPRATHVHPKEYFSRIMLPSSWIKPGRERQLHGALGHELLHVLASDPAPFTGIKWAVFLIANALEDARIEHQLYPKWPGLVRPVRELVKELLDFRKRQQALASSSQSAKIYEVGLALYLLLSGKEEKEVLGGTVPQMAIATAQELLHITSPALAAADTAEVVEIAQRIIDELEKAAERAAKKIGTTAAHQYSSSLRRELKEAMQKTVEEVLLSLARKALLGWPGLWYKGRGGYTFYPIKWEWDESESEKERSSFATPPLQELLRWLVEADPLIELQWERPRELTGRLVPSSGVLVQAAIGRDRRVFQRRDWTRQLVLPYVLGLADFFIMMEAHSGHGLARWALVKGVVMALARLLAECQARFVVRAWTATWVEVKEEVFDPVTKQRRTRTKQEHYINIAHIKGPEKPWGKKEEALLASLPRRGFNQPLEGYPKTMSWNMKFLAQRRLRLFLCVGDARMLNVLSGHLKYATAPLRGDGQRAIYIHLGQPIPSYDSLYRELESQFDEVVQASTLKDAVIGTLRAILFQLAG